MKDFAFRAAEFGSSQFCIEDKRAWLGQLLGMTCGNCGRDEGPLGARGLISLDTSLGRFEADQLDLVESSSDGTGARFVWKAGTSELKVESAWRFWPETGIWSRKDVLCNDRDDDGMVLETPI